MILVRVGAERVQLLADPGGQHGQVAGVQPDRAEPAAGQLDADPDRLEHVVGVDQQGGVLAQRGDLRRERLPLGAVQQGEGVRRGAAGGHAVATPGLQVGGGREPGDVGRPRGRHRGQLLGPAGAHLDAGPRSGHRGHPGRGRGDGGVVVVDAQQQGLQHHGLGEGALHDQHRGAGEVDLALGVAPDVAAEGVAGQPVRGGLVDDLAVEQEAQRLVVEPEVPQRPQRPADPGHHAVAAAFGQPAGEQLEDAAPGRGARPQGGPQHGQLVVVGQQGGGRHLARPPGRRHAGAGWVAVTAPA